LFIEIHNDIERINIFSQLIKHFFDVYFSSLDKNFDKVKIIYLIENYEYYSLILTQMKDIRILENLTEIIIYYTFESSEANKKSINKFNTDYTYVKQNSNSENDKSLGLLFYNNFTKVYYKLNL